MAANINRAEGFSRFRIIFRYTGTGRKVEGGMADRIQGRRARTDWHSELVFWVLTVGTWIVLFWLLWPRH